MLDSVARIAYVDRTVHVVKQRFLKLHETAHAVLLHQRDLYRVVEEDDLTLDPEISDLFDREANVSAAEVLFQPDGFIDEARQSSLVFGCRWV